MNDELIVDVIKELSCNSAAGLDGVPVALLKNASVELAKPLNILFNHSITIGHVPSTWKEAAVVLIYKGGDRSLARQSLLSLHMTKSYVRTATRSTLKVEANLTQILNFKANFHTEFEPFFQKKFMLTMVDTLRLSA